MKKPLLLLTSLLALAAVLITVKEFSPPSGEDLAPENSVVSAVSIQDQSWIYEAQEDNNCSYEIHLPVVQAQVGVISDAVAQGINDKIMDTVLHHLLGWGDGDIDTGAAQFLTDCTEDLALNSPPGSAWFADIQNEVTQNQDSILSMVIYWQGFTGGVHPNYASEGLIFDLRTGKQLSITDLILPEKLEAFSTLLAERLVEAVRDFEALDVDIYAPDFVTKYGSVYLSPEGLSIIYNPYEIASGPNTIEPITFSREELKDYLQIN